MSLIWSSRQRTANACTWYFNRSLVKKLYDIISMTLDHSGWTHLYSKTCSCNCHQPVLTLIKCMVFCYLLCSARGMAWPYMVLVHSSTSLNIALMTGCMAKSYNEAVCLEAICIIHMNLTLALRGLQRAVMLAAIFMANINSISGYDPQPSLPLVLALRLKYKLCHILES